MNTELRNMTKVLQREFDVWCDNNNIRWGCPLRDLYYKLYSLNADLNYVTALQNVLKDWNTPITPKKDSKTSRQKKLDRFKKCFSEELRSWFEDVGLRTSRRILGVIAGRYLHDRDAERLAGELEINRIVSGVLSAREFDLFTKRNSDPSVWAAERSRGNQADFHGTVFLVLLTDYLKKVSGKPHYHEAAMLLTSLRKSPIWPSTPRFRRRATATAKPAKKLNPNLARQSAIVKCRNWKKDNPDWLDWLTDMECHLDHQAKRIADAQSKKSCI